MLSLIWIPSSSKNDNTPKWNRGRWQHSRRKCRFVDVVTAMTAKEAWPTRILRWLIKHSVPRRKMDGQPTARGVTYICTQEIRNSWEKPETSTPRPRESRSLAQFPGLWATLGGYSPLCSPAFCTWFCFLRRLNYVYCISRLPSLRLELGFNQCRAAVGDGGKESEVKVYIFSWHSLCRGALDWL